MLRYAPWMSLATVALLGLLLAITGVGRSPAAGPSGSPRTLKSAGAAASSSVRHYVTLDQLAQTSRAARTSMADLSAVAHDRGQVSFADLSGGRPLVLVFIKDGCPCSIEFQPVFHRLAAAFDGQVQFVGVIDGDVTVARQYAAANSVLFPVLADADRTIIDRCEAKNAAYVALLEADGTLHSLWPGCSTSMLQDVCHKAALLSGHEDIAIDFPEMPAPLTTGCPFQP
jgi:peroxiredoxin